MPQDYLNLPAKSRQYVKRSGQISHLCYDDSSTLP